MLTTRRSAPRMTTAPIPAALLPRFGRWLDRDDVITRAHASSRPAMTASAQGVADFPHDPQAKAPGDYSEELHRVGIALRRDDLISGWIWSCALFLIGRPQQSYLLMCFRSPGCSTEKYLRVNCPLRPWSGPPQLTQGIRRSGEPPDRTLTTLYIAPQWGQLNGICFRLGMASVRSSPETGVARAARS